MQCDVYISYQRRARRTALRNGMRHNHAPHRPCSITCRKPKANLPTRGFFEPVRANETSGAPPCEFKMVLYISSNQSGEEAASSSRKAVWFSDFQKRFFSKCFWFSWFAFGSLGLGLFSCSELKVSMPQTTPKSMLAISKRS